MKTKKQGKIPVSKLKKRVKKNAYAEEYLSTSKTLTN